MAFRDMEAEIIPMCEDQGLAIVPWAALGGGRLKTKEQRKKDATSETARSEKGLRDIDIAVSETLEKIADAKGTTLQAVVSLLHHVSNNLQRSHVMYRQSHIYCSSRHMSFRSLAFRLSSM